MPELTSDDCNFNLQSSSVPRNWILQFVSSLITKRLKIDDICACGESPDDVTSSLAALLLQVLLVATHSKPDSERYGNAV